MSVPNIRPTATGGLSRVWQPLKVGGLTLTRVRCRSFAYSLIRGRWTKEIHLQ